MRLLWVAAAFALLFSLNFSCSSFTSDEDLALRTCGGCHLAPTPDMLDKKTWETHILPRMGAWLGVESKDILIDDIAGNAVYGQSEVIKLIPTEPAISYENWERIKAWYIGNAPEVLEAKSLPETYGDLGSKFSFEKILLEDSRQRATNTLIHFEKEQGKIYVGRRNGRFMIYDTQLNKLDSLKFDSSPSDFIPGAENSFEVLLTGEIRPNNEPIGSLIKTQTGNTKTLPLVPSLYRPVFVKKADLDGDGLEDYVICNFGFHVGKLAWYKNVGNNQFLENVLMGVPGSIQVEIEDLNGDGRLDILALLTQGNESVFAFKNLGKGQFKPEQWIQLPPVYGTTAFSFVDFDGDGFKDIAIACGDNADYSMIPKPYHGVRFFKNDGKEHFKEVKFVPLKGAAGLEVADFDLDGDPDLAVIANFAEFKETPQRGFVLLSNSGGFNFDPFLSRETDSGRYLVFEQGDFDNDGDVDLLLGSHMVPLMVGREELKKWQDQHLDMLLLRNKAK